VASCPGSVGVSHYYYSFDGLGSVVAVTDSSGSPVDTYSYDPVPCQNGTMCLSWALGGLPWLPGVLGDAGEEFAVWAGMAFVERSAGGAGQT
jgi:hypothetical protein